MPPPYQFHFFTQGSPTNFPLVFLHGFLGSCQDFASIITHLSQDFYCLALDLPGHGKTQVNGSPDYYKIDKIAQAIIDLLSQIRIKKCILLGYSMGGRLALYLALYYPSYFEKVIIESASPGLKTQPERELRLQQDYQLAEKLLRLDLLSFLQEWYAQPLFSSLKNHPEFPDLLARRRENNPQELAYCLLHLGTGCQPSLWEKLAENQVPLLLLVGELDSKFVAINQEMARIARVARLEILPGCGHNSHGENPSLFVRKLQDFLKKSCGQCKEI
jgi:2-succinyl-6-hydroxy-2,4-cyclohexadiene-1-carboxylate synthase